MATPSSLFDSAYEKDQLFRLGVTNTHKERRRYDYAYYDLSHLGELLAEATQRRSWEDNGCMIRFAVRSNKQLLFALEGARTAIVPGHGNLGGGAVFAAGNLYFNSEGNIITGFTHKSGDYRPPFESMVWLYALFQQSPLLATQGIYIAPSLTIRRLDPSANGEIDRHTVRTLDFIRELERFFPMADRIELLNANPSIEVIREFKAPKQTEGLELVSRDLSFGGDDNDEEGPAPAGTENIENLVRFNLFSQISAADDEEKNSSESTLNTRHTS